MIIYGKIYKMKDLKNSKLKHNQPKYIEAYQKLTKLIAGLKPGDRLPTEEELTQDFGVSRNTIRQALQVLHEDKIIYKRKGAGTYVSGTPYLGRSDISYYCDCRTTLEKLGFDVEEEEIAVTLENADTLVKDLLEPNKFSSIFYISKTYIDKHDHKKKYCFCEDYVPVNLDWEIDAKKIDKKSFIKEYERLGRASICNITAVPAGSFYGTKLGIEKYDPVLVLQQIVLDENGNRIYINKTYMNTNIPDYSILVNRKEEKLMM